MGDLNYDGVGFPMRKKYFSKFETKNNICINVYCYENKPTFRIYISCQKFDNPMNLLLVIDENKSNYVYITDFDRFLFQKTNNKNKKYFFQFYLQYFSSKNVLTDHKQICLSMNGTQSERLENLTTEFESYLKQIPVPFKVNADFECNLESVESYEVFYSKKCQDHIPCSFP